MSEEAEEMNEMISNMMVVLKQSMAQGMGIMITQAELFAANKDFTKNIATLYWNLYVDLVDKGFEPDQALRLVEVYTTSSGLGSVQK